jgi:glycosyltransferase involved in cell wall biosynthesis
MIDAVPSPTAPFRPTTRRSSRRRRGDRAVSADPLSVVHVVISMDVGGMERNVLNQVREGRRLGEEVSIVCLERRGTLAAAAEAMGARVVCLNKPPGVPPGMILRMRAALRDVRAAVVHSHQLSTMFYSGLAASLLPGVCLVHTAHGRDAYARPKRACWLGRLGGVRVERCFCLTEDIACEVVARGVIPRHKVRLIANGIETARYRGRRSDPGLRAAMKVPQGAPVIGTVGRLVPVKNQQLLIRAFARVRAAVPDAHLLLVGDGPLREDLIQLAVGLGLTDSVHFAGYRSDVIDYLGLMDVFALTSHSEGTPQSLLEASVAGVPVIASRVGGVPDAVEDGRSGLVFESGNEQALVLGLLSLLTDRALAAALAEAGRKRVIAHYDVSRMAREYHEQYLELLAGRQAGNRAGT